MPAETFLRTEDVPQLAAALDRLRKGADTVELTLGARTRTGHPSGSRRDWARSEVSTDRRPVPGHLASGDRPARDRATPATQLERYRQITNAVPGMTAWIIDRDLRCRFAAGDRLRPIAATPDACVDRPLAQLVSPDRFSAVRRHLEESFAGRSSTEESTGPGASNIGRDTFPSRRAQSDRGGSRREPGGSRPRADSRSAAPE